MTSSVDLERSRSRSATVIRRGPCVTALLTMSPSARVGLTNRAVGVEHVAFTTSPLGSGTCVGPGLCRDRREGGGQHDEECRAGGTGEQHGSSLAAVVPQCNHAPRRSIPSTISFSEPAKDIRTNSLPRWVSKSMPGAVATPVSSSSRWHQA